jgi:magnesium chelatase family protein
MHGCPCGYHGDVGHDRKCTPTSIRHYRARISGRLLDRIDIHLEVPAVKFKELASDDRAEPSTSIRRRVSRARLRQLERFKDNHRLFANAHMDTRDIRRYCAIDADSKTLVRAAILRLGLSARAYDRILKVARTIADLEGAESIQQAHVAEAIQYRTLDRDVIGKANS